MVRPLNVMECVLDRFSTNKCNETGVSDGVDTNKCDENEPDWVFISATYIGVKGCRSILAYWAPVISRKLSNVTG